MRYRINTGFSDLSNRDKRDLIILIRAINQGTNFCRNDNSIDLGSTYRIDTHRTSDNRVLAYYKSRRNLYRPDQVYYGELQSNGAESRTFAIVYYPDDASVDEIKNCFEDSLNDADKNAYAVERF